MVICECKVGCMNEKNYHALAFLNFIFGIISICLYLPYTIQSFNIKGFKWLNFAKDMLKENYQNALIYFGIFLLIWFIVITSISIINNISLSRMLFKLSAISSLLLPLVYVLALKYDWALEFWIKNIAPNVKMICYIVLSVSVGFSVLGLILNFTRENKANFHLILQSLIMNALLVLLILIQGWCGWSFGSQVKIFGILMGLFAIYLPISSFVLLICDKKRV